MVNKAIISAALCLVLTLPWGGTAMAQKQAKAFAYAALEGSGLSLDYEIYLGGLHAGSLNVSLRTENGGRGYSMHAITRTRGAIDFFVGFLSKARTSGLIAANARPRPLRHRVDNIWRGDKRFVDNTYLDDGRVKNSHFPSAEADDRDPVPPELQRNTVDPLTASFRLAIAAGDGCTGVVAVFDGRRRYNLRQSPAPEAQKRIDGPVFKGEARPCRIALERITGFSRRPWYDPGDDAEEVTMWYAPLIDGLPPIPVRLEASAGPATTLIHLTGIRLEGETVRIAGVSPASDADSR